MPSLGVGLYLGTIRITIYYPGTIILVLLLLFFLVAGYTLVGTYFGKFYSLLFLVSMDIPSCYEDGII
jgi:hypothetical protein